MSLELAHTPGLRRRVRQLLTQYPYRGFNGAVGENVRYLATDVRGRELAVMVFGAAPWKVAVRDRFIGWSVAQRQERLGALANQQRFLILPRVRVAHLASHLLAQAIQEQKLQPIVMSTDDMRVWRNGKHVPQTQWHRDPLGPPFQTNLRWGHRFLQASLVLPLYLQDGESSSRSIPVRFEMAPVVKKPGKKAAEADWAEYRRQKKEKNLSVQLSDTFMPMR